MDEQLLTEKLIGYETSEPEGIKQCAGFVKGWLEARDIDGAPDRRPRSARDDGRGRPGRRGADASCSTATSTSSLAARSSSSPGSRATA